MWVYDHVIHTDWVGASNGDSSRGVCDLFIMHQYPYPLNLAWTLKVRDPKLSQHWAKATPCMRKHWKVPWIASECWETSLYYTHGWSWSLRGSLVYFCGYIGWTTFNRHFPFQCQQFSLNSFHENMFCHFVNLVFWKHFLWKSDKSEVCGFKLCLARNPAGCMATVRRMAMPVTSHIGILHPCPCRGKGAIFIPGRFPKTRSPMVLQSCAISGEWSERLGRERIGPKAQEVCCVWKVQIQMRGQGTTTKRRQPREAVKPVSMKWLDKYHLKVYAVEISKLYTLEIYENEL